MEMSSLEERWWSCYSCSRLLQCKRVVQDMDSRFWTRYGLQSNGTGISCRFNNRCTTSSVRVAVVSSSWFLLIVETSIANMTISSQTGANSAITTIDAAISYVQAERSNLGAIQNRLTYTVDNLDKRYDQCSVCQKSCTRYRLCEGDC